MLPIIHKVASINYLDYETIVAFAQSHCFGGLQFGAKGLQEKEEARVNKGAIG